VTRGDHNVVGVEHLPEMHTRRDNHVTVLIYYNWLTVDQHMQSWDKSYEVKAGMTVFPARPCCRLNTHPWCWCGGRRRGRCGWRRRRGRCGRMRRRRSGRRGRRCGCMRRRCRCRCSLTVRDIDSARGDDYSIRFANHPVVITGRDNRSTE